MTPFRLVADVDEDLVLVDADDRAVDDLTLVDGGERRVVIRHELAVGVRSSRRLPRPLVGFSTVSLAIGERAV